MDPLRYKSKGGSKETSAYENVDQAYTSNGFFIIMYFLTAQGAYQVKRLPRIKELRHPRTCSTLYLLLACTRRITRTR